MMNVFISFSVTVSDIYRSDLNVSLVYSWVIISPAILPSCCQQPSNKMMYEQYDSSISGHRDNINWIWESHLGLVQIKDKCECLKFSCAGRKLYIWHFYEDNECEMFPHMTMSGHFWQIRFLK